MEITIAIKVDGKEIFNHVIEHSESKTENSFSQYARFFDETCIGWTKDAEYNLMLVKQQQMYANNLLKSNGYLFLNDVYDLFGIPRTKEGQIVGWLYKEDNPNGDNYVDFGIYNEHNNEFVNGFKNTVLLDFNVDGSIWEQLKD